MFVWARMIKCSFCNKVKRRYVVLARPICNKRQLGNLYEERAGLYLQEKNYQILERNFYAGRSGEIDIIARDEKGLLVIFECKYRLDSTHGDPLLAVNYKKQRQICRTTLYYYVRHGYGMDYPCRFDVIAFYVNGEMKHIENAFEFAR